MSFLEKVVRYFTQEPEPVRITLGRNEQCHCGSGSKYKKCCLPVDERKAAKQKTSGCGST